MRFVKLAEKIMLMLIKLYQYCISPFLMPSCRFTPSCSHYAAGSIREHGALKGFVMAAKRLSRCNPWGGCGYDPVPHKDKNK